MTTLFQCQPYNSEHEIDNHTTLVVKYWQITTTETHACDKVISKLHVTSITVLLWQA